VALFVPQKAGRGLRHRSRKRFGQNFLHDQAVLAQMIQEINPRPGNRIVEIGPGEGALTCPLLEVHGELTAIELDRNLVPVLEDKCQNIGALILLQGDASKFDFSTLVSGDDRLRIVGNLPYNISVPMLFRLADHAVIICDMHVLLQKEVAYRVAAQPGSSHYGRLAVMMQSIFEAVLLFDVGPSAFRPPPKVRSVFMRLTPHATPVIDISTKALAAVVTTAFSQRRKTLRNSLKSLLDSIQIQSADIDPARRAETLSLKEFASLARMLESDLL